VTILVAPLFFLLRISWIFACALHCNRKTWFCIFVAGFCFVFELKRRQKTWLFTAMSLVVYLLNSKQADCLSHQHVLKNQNVFWNFEGSWYTVIVLLAFEVRSSQVAKSKSSSCPRKIPSGELWPICQALLVSKFGKHLESAYWNVYLFYFIFIYTFFDLKSTFLSLHIAWNYHFQEPIMGSYHFAVF